MDYTVGVVGKRLGLKESEQQQGFCCKDIKS